MIATLSEAEIEEIAAAVERGSARLAGGPTDQGWSVYARGGQLWFRSWYPRDEQTLDEEERASDGQEVRALLRRHGRKIIRRG